jgi:hypothetical protein
MPPRFIISRFYILALMQHRSPMYQAAAFSLNIESRPVPVPEGLAVLFPAEAAPLHMLIMQYVAIGDLMRLIFHDLGESMDMPTELETRVGEMYKPKYAVIEEALNERLWKQNIEPQEALAAYEHYLTKCDRMLANARLLVSCRRPIYYETDEWPIDVSDVSAEMHKRHDDACAAFNRIQAECNASDEEEPPQDEEKSYEEQTDENQVEIV